MDDGKSPRQWQNRDIANNVLKSIKFHARWAGLEFTAPITVHSFRKSFGQDQADHGTPIHVLQQLMGYASIATTRTFYIRDTQGSEQEAAARYERLLAELPGVGRWTDPERVGRGPESGLTGASRCILMTYG